MRSFDEIYDFAVDRHGEDSVEARADVEVRAGVELAAIPDHRWLSQMAQRIFSAGFVWSVVEKKWPGFEEAFEGFEPDVLVTYGTEELARLQQDTRIIRNGQKIQATLANAHFVQEIAAEHGSFGRWVAEWPEHDMVGLWAALAKRGSRLGGMSGPMMLRFLGRDTFILSGDVVARLVAEGIVSKKPTSKRDLQRVQEAFSHWRAESGRSFGAISRVLAASIDA
ncbi:MAG: DNA-3-methyladenine glycosylase I [Proteobacteria bacterium]|nr:DNA-3-methyladenine glycosylase I [Pseudomonadota bacterium]